VIMKFAPFWKPGRERREKKEGRKQDNQTDANIKKKEKQKDETSVGETWETGGKKSQIGNVLTIGGRKELDTTGRGTTRTKTG